MTITRVVAALMIGTAILLSSCGGGGGGGSSPSAASPSGLDDLGSGELGLKR
jgi:hypothetical protein